MPHSPPIVIPGVFSARLVWSVAGVDFAVNIHHWQTGGPAPTNQAAVNAISDIYKDALVSSGLVTVVPTSTALARVGVRWLGAPNFPLIESTDPAVIGTSPEVILPLATALVATLRTQFVGRRFRGRHYQPGLSEAANGPGGTATAPVQTALEDFLGAVRANMALIGHVFGVVSSRAHDAMGAPIPPAFEPVTSIEVRDGVWDVQRRRNTPGI